MYTHKPALSLNRFFILNVYVKSYSYLVAIRSQHNTNKFKIQYLPYVPCTKTISLTTESNKDATTWLTARNVLTLVCFFHILYSRINEISHLITIHLITNWFNNYYSIHTLIHSILVLLYILYIYSMQMLVSTALKNQYTYYQKICMILQPMIPQICNTNKSVLFET